jgi:hypothetical protein
VCKSVVSIGLDAMPLTTDSRWPADYNARIVSAAVARTLLDGPARVGARPLPGIVAAESVGSDLSCWILSIGSRDCWPDGLAVRADDIAAAIRDVLDRPLTAVGAYLADRVRDAADPNTVRAPEAGSVGTRVTVVDASTVGIELSRPIAYLPQLLTMPQFTPRRAAVMDGSTLGPFEVARRTTTAIELRRTRSATAELPDELRFVLVPTWDEAIRRYDAGEIDLTPTTSCGPDGRDRLAGRPDATSVPIGVYGSIEFGSRSPIPPPHLRRSLAAVIDRRHIAAQLPGLVTAWSLGGDLPYPSGKDIDALRRAFHDGIEIAYGDFVPNDLVVRAVAARLAGALGVRVSTQALSFAQYVRAVVRHEFHLLYTLTSADFADQAATWAPWHSYAPAARNARFADAVLDGLIAEAEPVAGDGAVLAWGRVADRWMELMPRIPLVQVQANYLSSPRIGRCRIDFSGLPRYADFAVRTAMAARQY